MSVSEKLKALGERAVADRYLTIDQLREKYGADWPAKSSEAQSLIYAALPQIKAVVEAAERAKPWLFNSPLEDSLTRYSEVSAALSALDEALPGGDE